MTYINLNGIFQMINMKVSEGGRVVIPIEIRQMMELKEGDTVSWDCKDGVVTLTTRAQRLKNAQALVRKYIPADCSLVDELIADRRAEAARG